MKIIREGTKFYLSFNTSFTFMLVDKNLYVYNFFTDICSKTFTYLHSH